MKWTLLLDINELLNISTVCKYFYRQTISKTLWKELALHIHSKPSLIYKSPKFELDTAYNGDWLKLFVEKPRVRLDGVYISRINYIRQGCKFYTLAYIYDAIHVLIFFLKNYKMLKIITIIL